MTEGRALSLIVARELAANLATPMFLIDAAGNLVFYNEAAEHLVGRSWADLGEISSIEWGKMLDLHALDGAALSLRDTPPAVAYNDRRPAHDRLLARTFDGSTRAFEVTAYPLFATVDEMHGVVTIFWEAS